MKKEITWKTGDGRQVVFTAALRTEETLIANSKMTKPCCEIDYSATVAGKDVGGCGWLQTVKPQTVGNVTIVAGLGNLGIAETNYRRILDAVAEIKRSDYWTDWQRRAEDSEKVEEDYRAHVARVNEMMGE